MTQLHGKIVRRRGVPYHNQSECGHVLNGKHIHYVPEKATEGKEIITCYAGEGSRQIFIPKHAPTVYPKILPNSECARLKNQAKVVTKKERQRMIHEAHNEKMRLREESQQRKNLLSKAQIQVNKQQVSLVNPEDVNLLKRAHVLLQEEEQEVKQFNSIVLATKCKAVREAQIAERIMIEKELKEERDRMDEMMERTRQLQIAKEKEKKQLDEKKNQKFVGLIKQQMRENEMQRMIEAEKLELETKRINKAMIAMQREDAEKERRRLDNIKKMQRDLKEATESLEDYKRMQEEEEKIQNQKIREFMRQKTEREEARERELQAAQLKKEKEIAKLRRMQQRAQDLKAMADELNAKREQERAEKNWREQEKLAAIKRKQQGEILKRERQRQIEDLRRQQALDLELDKAECLRVAKVQKEQFEREKDVRAKKREEANRYRKELLKQINENERNKINVQQGKFMEGEALRTEQELRKLKIKETLEKKMARLKEENVQEKDVAEIQRRMALIIK